MPTNETLLSMSPAEHGHYMSTHPNAGPATSAILRDVATIPVTPAVRAMIEAAFRRADAEDAAAVAAMDSVPQILADEREDAERWDYDFMGRS